MSRENSKKIRARIIFVEAVLFLLILFLGVKAVEIQILQSVDLSRKAKDEYTGFVTVHGKRGEILDRNQNRLATTVDAFSVAASPEKICNPAKLKLVFRNPQSQIRNRFTPSLQYFYYVIPAWWNRFLYAIKPLIDICCCDYNKTCVRMVKYDDNMAQVQIHLTRNFLYFMISHCVIRGRRDS